MSYFADLCERFMPRHAELLDTRSKRQQRIDAGELPDFDPSTQTIREGDWHIRPLPKDLTRRRIEITGPVDRKMVINALNANVDCYMADFEDSQSPTWDGLLDGQVNLIDANRNTLSYQDPKSGKAYNVNPNPALLIARVRGLHLREKHLCFEDLPVPGALLDFALYFYHNYRVRLDEGTGVYFYLPKLEHSSEAQWWSDVFHYSEQRFQLKPGTIRATVLIETLPAVFQMHEILHALRDHIA
ncbi:MAG: malate synthase A, partial [Pseudomonadota bacterium]|nr:malate synthase A [Pseudomonadota bacterium]